MVTPSSRTDCPHASLLRRTQLKLTPLAFAMTLIGVISLSAAHAKDPDVSLSNTVKPPPSIAQNCAIHGYACPTGLTCKLQAPPPAADSLINQYVAYTCRHPQAANPKATTCPTGLVAQWVTPPTGAGQAGVATLRCVPDPRACPSFSTAWVKQQAWPLDWPALGYTCRYARSMR
jgi:hypothetical protein